MKLWLPALLMLTACAERKPASIRGTVFFKGTAPAARVISMDSEQACAALHEAPVTEQLIVTGPQGGLANVFVYLAGDLPKTTAPAQAVVIEQKGCQFVPRVIGLQTGQTLTVKNSDPVSHNIHPMPRSNRDWNQQQPPGAPDLQRRFGFSEVMIPVKCNVHSWMRSYLGVLDHSYFRVTDASGAFALDGIPPGVYAVNAWHETLGLVSKAVKLSDGSTEALEFVMR